MNGARAVEVVTATQRHLDAAAHLAWERMDDARDTPLFDMCRDLAYSAKDRADGFRAGISLLGELPGPMLAPYAVKLLSVAPDPDDNLNFHDGFSAALRTVLS